MFLERWNFLDSLYMTVITLATDIDNVFLILTARQLNPDLFIVARTANQGSKSKLIAAGADKECRRQYAVQSVF